MHLSPPTPLPSNPLPSPHSADYQDAIAQLPQLLAAFPREHWLALRRNLGCVWPRIMWLREESARSHLTRGQTPRPPAPAGGRAAAVRGSGPGEPGTEPAAEPAAESAGLEQFDAWETMMAALARKAAARRGEALPPFRWEAASHSCGRV